MKKYKFFLSTTLLVIILAACTPAQSTPPIINMTEVQSTAIVIAQTKIALTQAAPPTTATPEPTPTLVLPTVPPTLSPPPIFTPDAIQVERWQEYQTELIKAVLAGYDPVLYDYALCEWDILGHSGQEVYVWALCATSGGGGSGSIPAVIHLELDGSVQNVEVPMRGSMWDSHIAKMFPENVQEKLYIYFYPPILGGRPSEMGTHLIYRQTHPEEPPWIVLSVMPTATPMP